MSARNWTDEPIFDVAQDELSTSHVARRAAELIAENYDPSSSVVFGLSGPWGSGKSSLIKLTCNYLESEYSADQWGIAYFTPWATEGIGGMLSEFYATIASVFPEISGKGKKALAALAKMGTVGFKLIPVAGEAMSEGSALVADRLTESNWQTSFEKVSKQLRKLERRILIVVDDIDRLHSDELVNLLKVVRLLGRFPGVSYLLAYDEGTLFANLRNAHVGAESREGARQFMEKIVQYPLAVPPLLRSQMIERLDKGITSVLSDLNRQVLDEDPRLSKHLDEFESQLVTPRGVDRFVAQMRTHLPMHEVGEIDDVDLILLIFIRLQFPDLYADLPRWKRRLTASPSAWESATGRSKEPADWGSLLAKISDETDRNDAHAILTSLFPVIKGGHSRGRPHVCQPEYFNRYFVHSVPDDDVPDAVVREAFIEACAPTESGAKLRILLSNESRERSNLAFSKLIDEVDRDHSSNGQVLALSSNLMQVLKVLDDKRDGAFLGRNMFQRVIFLVAKLLKQLSPETLSSSVESVLGAAPDLQTRMTVLYETCEGGENVPDHLKPSLESISKEALSAALEHLTQRDAASVDVPCNFYLDFIVRFGDKSGARMAIDELLKSTVTSEDLAARCISIHTLVARDPLRRLGDFRDETFVALVSDQDTFYDSVREHPVDEFDTTWPNRRKYARGRARRRDD